MKSVLALLLPTLAAAWPSNIKCDLKGSTSAKDMATETTIMGFPVVDSAVVATPSATTYTAGSVVTWTYDATLFTQGFIKASAGAITGVGGSTTGQYASKGILTDCGSTTAVAQWTSASLALGLCPSLASCAALLPRAQRTPACTTK